MRRSTSARASARVTFCNELAGMDAKVEAGELGVVGADVRFNSGER